MLKIFIIKEGYVYCLWLSYYCLSTYRALSLPLCK